MPTTVTIEFYGIPRRRAGRAELTVPAATVAEALAAVEAACPSFNDLRHEGQLAAHWLLSINGARFVKDLNQPLLSGERLLVLSADVGG